MKSVKPVLNISIRPFEKTDAGFCYRIRRRAFLNLFGQEIGKEAAEAGAEAYSPGNFIEFAKDNPFFLIELNENPVGFLIIKRVNLNTARLFLIYIDENHLGKGIGKKGYLHAEQWIRIHWRSVNTIFVDTVIPDYNGRFYEKMGFSPAEETTCTFPGKTIRAVRFKKQLN